MVMIATEDGVVVENTGRLIKLKHSAKEIATAISSAAKPAVVETNEWTEFSANVEMVPKVVSYTGRVWQDIQPACGGMALTNLTNKDNNELKPHSGKRRGRARNQDNGGVLAKIPSTKDGRTVRWNTRSIMTAQSISHTDGSVQTANYDPHALENTYHPRNHSDAFGFSTPVGRSTSMLSEGSVSDSPTYGEISQKKSAEPCEGRHEYTQQVNGGKEKAAVEEINNVDKDMVSPLGEAFLEQDSLSYSSDDEGTNFLGEEALPRKHHTKSK